MNEAAADIVVDNRGLERIGANPLNRGIYFDAKLFAETSTLLV